MDAQRYLKYHEDTRENRSYPKVHKSVRSCKSENRLPLYERYDWEVKKRQQKLEVAILISTSLGETTGKNGKRAESTKGRNGKT